MTPKLFHFHLPFFIWKVWKVSERKIKSQKSHELKELFR